MAGGYTCSCSGGWVSWALDSAFLLNFRCLPSPCFMLVSPELQIHTEVRMVANVLLCC